MNTATEGSERAYGACQICEGDFITRRDAMVLHGYKRPGHGTVSGRCPGASELAYELSCDTLKKHLEATKQALEFAEKYDASLQTATYVERHGSRWERGCYSVGVTPVWKMIEMLRGSRSDAAQHVRYLKGDIERLEKRIANWSLRELRDPPPKADPKARMQRHRR